MADPAVVRTAGRVSEDRLVAAREAVRARLPPTPLVRSHWAGASLKLESLQQTGAYKVRGALAALTAQVARGDVRPVVCASAGNHAAGMAWAARALGLRAVAVVPRQAPETKVARTRGLGAEVIRQGPSFEAAAAWARDLAQARGYRFLHPFDDPDVIAGQATVGAELLAHAPDVVVVPVGGGGLASGVCLALAHRGVRVVGVRVCDADRMHSVADGVRVEVLGERTAAILDLYLHDLVMVTDAEVREAMRRLYVEDGLVVEGAGAVAAAGLGRVSGRRRVAVVSGGNVDPSVFRGICEVAA